jgi:hypothetical protein
MRNFSREKEIQKAALECISLLCTCNLTCAMELGRAGAPALVVKCMNSFVSDCEMQRIGCICIQKLAIYSPNVQLLGEGGACAALAAAAPSCIVSNFFAVHETVQALCIYPPNVEKFGHAEFCAILVSQLNEYNDGSSVSKVHTHPWQQVIYHWIYRATSSP